MYEQFPTGTTCLGEQALTKVYWIELEHFLKEFKLCTGRKMVLLKTDT
ncbi:hypothetical protein [Pseudothermotoga sp.]